MLQGFRAEILIVAQDPARFGPEAIRHHADGLLVVEDGEVAAVGAHAALIDGFPGLSVRTYPGKLICAGFVDTHVHYPQVDRMAAHGSQLLDWLERHIFPAELAFADPAHAARTSAFFLDEMLRNGTTSALVYGTVHAGSIDALFEQALARGMRIVAGKVLMDCNAPPDLCDTPQSGRAESEALIARWRGRGRLGYAVTPRFALTSSDAQLAGAGAMLEAHPDVYLHTHLAENPAEIAAVADRFPQAADYLDVYDRFGLVGRRSVFAHAIHLDDRAMGRMGQAGASIAFCPSSNLFLGSGLFDLALADRHGVGVSLGTDIGAGLSFSLLHAVGEAYKVCQMRGCSLDPFRALYLATAAGARRLGCGVLAPGDAADFVVLDPAATPLLARRTAGADIAETLFALQMLGDDRCVAETYVAGVRRYARDADLEPAP